MLTGLHSLIFHEVSNTLFPSQIDPEGFLRKCGITNKQCLLKENKKEAVLGLASICHPYTRKYHPYDSGNKASQKKTELIFNFIKRKEKTNSTCH